MSREVEDRIADTAQRQHGTVTLRQLVLAGLSPSAVRHRARSGRLRLLHRGVYLAVPFPLAHTREMAAVLASGAGAVVSHLSAAALWGLEARAGVETTAPVHVTLVGNRARRPGIRVHRVARLGDEERALRYGIPITTPGRTLLDLAAVTGAKELEAAVARAEREGLGAPESLAALLACHRGHAGTRLLKEVADVPAGPALTRSAAEMSFLALVRSAGLPAPECNVSVGPYEIDFLWRSAGIAVEVDGFRYHSSRPRFEGDRRRDARLHAAGMTVIRLSWRQITRDAIATAVQVGQALALAQGNRR